MYLIGDLHITAKEPYRSALDLAMSDIIKNIEEDESLIFVGDFFHTGHPVPSEISMARNFLERLRVQTKKIFILAGNHDFSFKGGKEECALDTIEDMATIVKDPQELNGIHFLPFFYRKEGKSIYDWYTPEYLSTIKSPVTIGHFFSDDLGDFSEDLKKNMKHVDLSSIRNKTRIVLGHDHTPRGEYIGSVIPLEFSPDYPDRYMIRLTDTNCEYIKLQRTINFKVIQDTDLENLKSDIPMFVKVFTESRGTYEELRAKPFLKKNIWLHSVMFVDKKDDAVIESDEEFENATDYDKMVKFLNEKGKDIPENVQARLLEVMR